MLSQHTAALGQNIVRIARRASRLGAGHSEQVYQKAMSYELQRLSIEHTLEFNVSIVYEGMHLGSERADIYLRTARDTCVVELKATDGSMRRKKGAVQAGDAVPAAHVQLMKYIRLLSTDAYPTTPTLGMVVNFRQRVLMPESEAGPGSEAGTAPPNDACELEIDLYDPCTKTWVYDYDAVANAAAADAADDAADDVHAGLAPPQRSD